MERSIELDQESTFYPESVLYPGSPCCWSWSVWLTNTEKELEEIDRITYSLHPCFSNPTRIIRTADNGFRLSVEKEEDTWGTFTLQLRVAWKDGKHVRKEVTLYLRDSTGQPAPHLLDPLLDPNSEASPEDLLKFAKRLKNKKAFGYARQILTQARERLSQAQALPQNLPEVLIQQHALCTYKDAELPNKQRLDDALRILEQC